jgi:hypothetical protein
MILMIPTAGKIKLPTLNHYERHESCSCPITTTVFLEKRISSLFSTMVIPMVIPSRIF